MIEVDHADAAECVRSHFRRSRLREFVAGQLLYRDLERFRPSGAQDFHRHGRTRVGPAYLQLQMAAVGHWLVVEFHNHVTILQPSFVGGTFRHDFRHQCAFGLLELEFLGECGREILNVYSEKSSLDVSVLYQTFQDPTRQVRRHGKSDALIAAAFAEDGRADADEPAVGIHERATGVTGVDGRVSLDEILVIQVQGGASLGADDTGGDGLPDPERIADGQYDKDQNFDCIRKLRVAETRPEHFDRALADGKVSSNVYLRRIHNHALGMEWLLKSVIPRLQWPKPVYKEKRAITAAEHAAILGAEVNPERKGFYQLCWHLGGSQGDLASLKGVDVDWTNGTVSFTRKKTGVPVIVRLGTEALNLLKDLPAEGFLFPYLATVRAGDRATEFRSRCRQLDIKGVTLHSYRYAWAERALKCGYPERFAMENLGHNSKAVHRAYAKRALMKLPSLEEYEEAAEKAEILKVET